MNVLLVRKFQMGDVAAFEEILREEQTRMMRFILSYVHLPDHADDIYQEVWVEIWKRRETLRKPDRFLSWAYQITRRKIHSFLKDHNWRQHVALFGDDESHADIRDDSPGPAEIVEQAQWNAALNAEIARLDQQSQEILALRYSGDMKFREIAEVMNLPMGTVTVTAYRAMDKLQKGLRVRGYAPPTRTRAKKDE